MYSKTKMTKPVAVSLRRDMFIVAFFSGLNEEGWQMRYHLPGSLFSLRCGFKKSACAKKEKKKKRFELSYERHLTVGGQLIKALWEPRSERRQIWLTVYCSLQLNRHLLHSRIIIVLSNIKTFSLNFTTMWLAIIRWALSHCFATANNNHAREKYLLPTLTRLPFLHPDSVWSSRISLTSLWSAFPLSIYESILDGEGKKGTIKISSITSRVTPPRQTFFGRSPN